MRNSIIFIFSLFILTGCSMDDEQIWGFGNIVFSLFLALVFATRFAPRLQEISVIKRIIDSSKCFFNYLVYVFFALALVLFSLGIISFLMHKDRVPQNLMLYIGVVLVYFSYSFKLWCAEEDKFLRRDFFRKMGLSISFAVALFFLYFGAPGISI